jgi:hypothetical protein
MGSDSSTVLIVFDRLNPRVVVVLEECILDEDSIFEVALFSAAFFGTVVFGAAFGGRVSRRFLRRDPSEANGSSESSERSSKWFGLKVDLASIYRSDSNLKA